MQRTFDGKHIKEGTLVVRKAGDVALDYFIIKMTDILVTSVITGASGSEDRLTENVTLNFAKVEIDYVPQKADGSADTTKKAGWNIAENASTV
jgi:type VI secretion system secreted protein Hcp